MVEPNLGASPFDGLAGDERWPGWGCRRLGTSGPVDFFIRQGEPAAPLHLAFAAPDRAIVDSFHAATLGAGCSRGDQLDEQPLCSRVSTTGLLTRLLRTRR